MYLVAFTFIVMHVCVCSYMRAQLDPAVQVYTGRSERSYHICWHEGEYEAPKTRGTSYYTYIWYIFMYVHEHTPVLLVNRMIVKTIGGYTYVFLSIKCTFPNDLYIQPNLHEVVLI